MCVWPVCFGELAVFEDVDFGGCDAGAVDLFNLERGVDVQLRSRLVEDGCGDSGVQECTEKHVAGDPGEAFKIGDAHRFYCFTPRRSVPCDGAALMRANGVRRLFRSRDG